MKINIPIGLFLETERPSGFFLCLFWCSDRPFFFFRTVLFGNRFENAKEKSSRRVPIYTHLLFQRSLHRFGFPAGASGQSQKSRILKKDCEEHKGNLLSLSVLAQAEPGVWVISRKRARCLHVEALKKAICLHMEAPLFGCRTTRKK